MVAQAKQNEVSALCQAAGKQSDPGGRQINITGYGIRDNLIAEQNSRHS